MNMKQSNLATLGNTARLGCILHILIIRIFRHTESTSHLEAMPLLQLLALLITLSCQPDAAPQLAHRCPILAYSSQEVHLCPHIRALEVALDRD